MSTEPVPVGEIVRRMCACGHAATVDITSRNGVRMVQACDRCAPQARRWASRAGPICETPVLSDQEPTTLF